MFINIVPPGVSGWFIGVDWLGNSSTYARARFRLLLSCPLYFFPYLRFSSYLCLFMLFHSCCSHARVFGKTLVHEFHISYSHTEWYILALVKIYKPGSFIEACYDKKINETIEYDITNEEPARFFRKNN